jgi:hypothetical protein
MKKAVNNGLILLSIGCPSPMRMWAAAVPLHSMGCEPDRTDREKPCQEFGGPTTGCHFN